MKLKLLTIFFIGLSTSNGFAQTDSTATSSAINSTKNVNHSLNEQYRQLLSRSITSPDGYKMVNPYRLQTLWKNVSDTLRKATIERNSLTEQLKEQTKNSTYLKTEISRRDEALATQHLKVNQVSFLGIAFHKTTYHIVIWGIILCLIIALATFIIRYKRNNYIAKHHSVLYREVSEEYQIFKTKAHEREQKLARELQDERNKLEELLSKK